MRVQVVLIRRLPQEAAGSLAIVHTSRGLIDQAATSFFLTTAIWLPWLAPYLRDLWQRLEARRVRS
jgi:hypothetical protein